MPKKQLSLVIIGLVTALVAGGVAFIQHKKPLAPEQKGLSKVTVWVSTTQQQTTTEARIEQVKEELDERGNYVATFAFQKGDNHNGAEINLLLGLEKSICPETAGQNANQSLRYQTPSSWPTQGYCFTPWQNDETVTINLNEQNNFYQELPIISQQEYSLACGSFQTNLWVMSLNGSETFSLRDSQNLQKTHQECPVRRNGGFELTHEGKVYPNACLVSAFANLQTGNDLKACLADRSLAPVQALPIDVSKCPGESLTSVEKVDLSCGYCKDGLCPIGSSTCRWQTPANLQKQALTYKFEVFDITAQETTKTGTTVANLVSFTPLVDHNYECKITVSNACGDSQVVSAQQICRSDVMPSIALPTAPTALSPTPQAIGTISRLISPTPPAGGPLPTVSKPTLTPSPTQITPTPTSIYANATSTPPPAGQSPLGGATPQSATLPNSGLTLPTYMAIAFSLFLFVAGVAILL